jgi:hypothetical protein
MASFYTPLDVSKKEIRLIRVNLSHDWLRPICCTISKHSLDNAPPYQALSYVWGDPQNTESITVGNFVLPVTRNLAAFLRELRRRGYEKLLKEEEDVTDVDNNTTWPLWVDAICINQSNVLERNEQVILMEPIYSLANVSLSWLGEPSGDSNLAMDSFQKLGQVLVSSAEHMAEPLQWHDLPQQFFLNDMSEEPHNSTWLSIERLLKRKYWTRAWIFQEMVIPDCIQLLCGSATCDLSHMILAGCWFRDLLAGKCPVGIEPIVWPHMVQVRPYLQELYSIGRAHFHYHGRPGNGLDHECAVWPHPEYDWDILLAARGKEATVPHDAIYAFLAISRLPIRPAYEQPLHYLYLSVARLGIQCKRLEAVLCCATKTENYQPSDLTPSWVPEWLPRRQGWECGFLLRYLNIYNANSNASASGCAAVGENGQLLLTGKACGIVRHTGPVALPFGISEQILDILRHYGPPKRYVTGIPLLQAILRTLLCDHDGRGSRLHFAARQNHAVFMSVILVALAGDLQSAADHFEGTAHDLTSLLGIPTDQNFAQSYASTVLDEESHQIAGSTFQEIIAPFIIDLVARDGDEDDVGRHLSTLVSETRLFLTEQGYVGNAPSDVKLGDCVVVSPYSRLPLLLRKRGATYQNIGPCFVLGMMDGEMLTSENECTNVVIV